MGSNVTFARRAAGADASRLGAILDRALAAGPTAVFCATASAAPPDGALSPGRARIFLGLSGVRRMRIARSGQIRDVRLRTGQALFAGAATWHCSLPKRPHTVLSIIFDPAYTHVTCKGLTRHRGRVRAVPGVTHSLGVRTGGVAGGLVAALSGIAGTELEGRTALSLARALLLVMRRDLAAERPGVSKGRAAFMAACAHLRDNYHLPLTRDAVARELGIHPNHLSRLFRVHGARGFADQLTHVRMEAAALMLRGYALSVKEVAARCGYDSANYFGKVFRRSYGESPGAFAARHGDVDAGTAARDRPRWRRGGG